MHDFERLGDAVVAGAEDFGVLLRGFQAPFPGVLERLDLGLGLLPALLGEQHVVVGVGIERRVEIDQVHRLVVHVAPKDVEVVAVVEQVARHVSHPHNTLTDSGVSLKSSEGSLVQLPQAPS